MIAARLPRTFALRTLLGVVAYAAVVVASITTATSVAYVAAVAANLLSATLATRGAFRETGPLRTFYLIFAFGVVISVAWSALASMPIVGWSLLRSMLNASPFSPTRPVISPV